MAYYNASALTVYHFCPTFRLLSHIYIPAMSDLKAIASPEMNAKQLHRDID